MDTVNYLGIIAPMTVKPNRIEDTKDEWYHARFGRWVVWMANSQQHREHIKRREINKNFYSPNKQWYFEEDLECFLMDTSGQSNTRIKTEYNMIQVMGNTYLGGAIDMNITAKCQAFSPLSATRRELSLAKMIYWTEIAKKSSPEYAEYLKSKFPIGDTPPITEGIFNNLYTDEYVRSMNAMLRYGAKANRFEDHRKVLALDLFLSGMCVMKPYIRGTEYKVKPIPSERFFFDRSAKDPMLYDAGYMGEFDVMLPTDIYEEYPNIGQDSRQAIERVVSSSTSTWNLNGRVVVYKTVWRDVVAEKYGYVKDELDNIYFARLDFDEYSDKPTYTLKDVVDVSELNKKQREYIGKKSGKATKTVYCDQWRYCDFIPSELIGGYMNPSPSKMTDIVLEYGVMPYQEQDINSADNMMPPYKVSFYIYLDGDVFSPVDIAINPQRMLNRTNSVLENILNNATGTSLLYDPDMIENEEELLTNLKQSKPIGIRTKGLGMQNIVSKHDGTPSQGMVAYSNMMSMFAQQLESITGVNSAMKGQQNSADQLVGVTQLMIKRGTITQAMFYDAIAKVYLQVFRALAESGKRFYIQHKKELIDIAGDEGATVISLSEDMKNEHFRVDVTTSLSPEDERKETDTKILQFVQIGFLDRTRAANLLGRAYEEDMYSAIREYARESNLVAAAKEDSEARQQQTMTALGMAQQQEQSQNAVASAKGEMELKNKELDIKQQKNVLDAATKVHATNSANRGGE